VEKLEKAGYTAAGLHANKSQSQRKHALDNFRSGKLQILVATDIAARGLDIAAISHVVNFDIPDSATTYIHRIGRTGRAARSGDAFTLVTPEDRGMVRDIEKILGKPIEKRIVEGFDYHEKATTKEHVERAHARPTGFHPKNAFGGGVSKSNPYNYGGAPNRGGAPSRSGASTRSGAPSRSGSRSGAPSRSGAAGKGAGYSSPRSRY
jgi:ATP-dependent RNA helicase RhlE